MSDAPTPNDEKPLPAGASITNQVVLEDKKVVDITPPTPPTKPATRRTTSRKTRSGSAFGLVFTVLIVVGVVVLMIWLSKRQRKQMEKMCGGIKDWAQKILCMQSMGAGSSGMRGRRGMGSGINIRL